MDRPPQRSLEYLVLKIERDRLRLQRYERTEPNSAFTRELRTDFEEDRRRLEELIAHNEEQVRRWPAAYPEAPGWVSDMKVMLEAFGPKP